jgi:spore photoproduct lyase
LSRSWNFRRLVISDPACRTTHGEWLAGQFVERGREILSCGEHELEAHATPGTLICGYAPESGWIARAEHGTLAVRPDEYYVNPIVGCRYRCTYCYLQGTSSRLPLRLYLGIPDLRREIDALFSALPPSTEPRLCSGENADSLADSELYPIGAILAEEVARGQRGSLELRTKSDKVDSLLNVNHQGRTVIAFSLAPQDIVDSFEGGTASLAARLRAAQRCQEHGYPVALKLEPLHLEAHWRNPYRQLISQIATSLATDRIDHVTIGSLRASPVLLAKTPFSYHHSDALREGEQISYRSGATNTMPPMSDRLSAYRDVRAMLREENISSPIWLSMETPEVVAIWKGESHNLYLPASKLN